MTKTATTPNQRRMHALMIASLLFGLYTIVLSRLAYVQVTTAASSESKQRAVSARSNHRIGKSLFERGRRGLITDRNGVVLATGFPSYRLFADPHAETLAKRAKERTLEERAEYLISILDELGLGLSRTEKNDIFDRATELYWDPKDADAEAAPATPGPRKVRSRLLIEGLRPQHRVVIRDRLQKAGITNFFFAVESNRAYPEGALTGEIVGFVGQGDVSKDPSGQAGIEKSFDRILSGEPGRYVCEKDGNGNEFDIDGRYLDLPVDGGDVRLTIDVRIQRILYESLKRAYLKFRWKEFVAVGIVLDARTNQVLAMKNFPDYSPNELKETDHFDMNRTLVHAVQSSWEPGSTFKPFVAAKVLEAGAASLDESFATGVGTHAFTYGGASRNIRDSHPCGTVTFSEILTKSSNIGMVMIGLQRLGFDRLYQGVESYGFREKPGVCLPNEVHGFYYKKKDAKPIYTGASLTFGQEIQMPPLLLAAKYQIFGSSGVYTPPSLVDAVVADGIEHKDRRPPVRLLTPRVADTIRDILTDAVRTGTCKMLDDLPWTIAAKTGTAQNLAPRAVVGTYNASMVALAPAKEPRITVYVMARAVRGSTYYGGSVAGPVVRETIDGVLRLMNVPFEKEVPQNGDDR